MSHDVHARADKHGNPLFPAFTRLNTNHNIRYNNWIRSMAELERCDGTYRRRRWPFKTMGPVRLWQQYIEESMVNKEDRAENIGARPCMQDVTCASKLRLLRTSRACTTEAREEPR